MDKFRVVCIGAGYFAKFHVEAWTRIPEVEVVAICDFDMEKAQILAKEFNVDSVFYSIEEAYKNVSFEILDIITPPESHSDLCRQAGQ